MSPLETIVGWLLVVTGGIAAVILLACAGAFWALEHFGRGV